MIQKVDHMMKEVQIIAAPVEILQAKPAVLDELDGIIEEPKYLVKWSNGEFTLCIIIMI